MKDNPFSLDGRTILVTGASSGIGRQTAVTVSAAGATVLAGGRNEARLDETLQMLEGGGHQALRADLSSDEERKRVAEACPPLDGVVHAAGILILAPVKMVTQKILRKVQAINVEAPVCLTRDLLRLDRLRPGASIVCVSSAAPHRAFPAQTAYATSKAGLEAASRVMAFELGPREIRCNCLCPGTVLTSMLDGSAVIREQLAQNEAGYPLGFGEPEDVANAAVFLLSRASRWITGTSVILDGGLLCQP